MREKNQRKTKEKKSLCYAGDSFIFLFIFQLRNKKIGEGSIWRLNYISLGL